MATAPCPPHSTVQSAIISSSWKSCSPALPVRGSSRPSQQAMNRSKPSSHATCLLRRKVESISPEPRKPPLGCQGDSKCESPVAPLLVTAWAIMVWSKTANVLTEIWPTLLLPPLLAIGWFGGRRLLRLAETNFWSLNALAVQPIYVLCREGLRHLVESPLPPGLHPSWRTAIRATCAAVAGIGVFLLGAGVIALLWPATRWVSRFPDLGSVHDTLPVLLANSVTLITAYCAGAALVWGIGDALMAQPRDLQDFAPPERGERTWRVAHLSDIHTVGERYGVRIESGRAGPRGNDRLRQTLARLDEIHQQQPLDFVLITGDLTDAGRSAEWAEFLIAVSVYPHLAERIIPTVSLVS